MGPRQIAALVRSRKDEEARRCIEEQIRLSVQWWLVTIWELLHYVYYIDLQCS